MATNLEFLRDGFRRLAELPADELAEWIDDCYISEVEDLFHTIVGYYPKTTPCKIRPISEDCRLDECISCIKNWLEADNGEIH